MLSGVINPRTSSIFVADTLDTVLILSTTVIVHCEHTHSETTQELQLV